MVNEEKKYVQMCISFKTPQGLVLSPVNPINPSLYLERLSKTQIGIKFNRSYPDSIPKCAVDSLQKKDITITNASGTSFYVYIF